MDTDEFPARERLRHWIAHLEHVLPAQAPIRDFVHHNTLHGFQHLPFAEALAAVHRLTGARSYLEEERFREFFAAGRIEHADLAAALDDLGIAGLDEEIAAGFGRRDILLASLLEPRDLPSRARLAWESRELAAADAGLWAACLALPPDALPGSPAQEAPWQEETLAWWDELADRVGRDWTLGALIEHLTGEDPLAAVRTMLQRHVAAHLDLGVAAWRNPERGRGFYAAWRASAGQDFAWALDGFPNLPDEIASLPDDPLAAIERELAQLLPDEDRWPAYVEHLCLDWPGWSGMFLWRSRHPERGDGTPVDMADFLAVRLFLERVLGAEAVRRLTGTPGDLADLGAWFADNPAQLYVRHARHVFSLPEDLQHRVGALLRREGAENTEWTALAGDMAAARRGADSRAAEAWRFFRLVRRLGMTAPAVAALSSEAAAALARCAGELDPLARGQAWLLAYERHYRERIFAALAANRGRSFPAPQAQMVFCMDDREEGTRRHLEEIAPAIQTFGAAGFFGIPMLWQGLDDPAPVALCPVAVKPAHLVREEAAPQAVARHASRRAWRLLWRDRFYQGSRRGALAGPLLAAAGALPALAAMFLATVAPGWLGETLQRWRTRFETAVTTRAAVTAAAPGGEVPRPGFGDDEQARLVGDFLESIGLTNGFAPLVVMLGHGSSSRNNPHLSAYDCGACAGRHGGPNARAFAAMANRPEVRRLLAARGIAIPSGTWFAAAEHDTCDDGIAWYDADLVPAGLQPAFERLAGQLEEAAWAHAAERCRRFAKAPAAASPAQARRHVLGRRHDISQARPELGHATNACALVGRRAMSRGLFLDRRAFLISYDPAADADGAILEKLLLAVAPVGAGISLEYYFSTVDNERFGCSSKVTHNIAGLFGVMEGAESDLRTGLPRQMIEIHEAMRLLVVVEQTPAVLSAIVGRQPALRELIGNAWIVVAACDPESGALSRYCPRRGWLPWAGEAPPPQVERAADWYRGRREALAPALITGVTA